MFGLTEADLSNRSVLGCGDGPASFNAEAARHGHRVFSCDPIYQFSAQEIRRRVHEVYDQIMDQLHPNQDAYVWQLFASPEELGRVRMAAMYRFLDDYDRGKREGRYINASLPFLPFPDSTFDLALCSHLLFTYSEHLSLDFHRDAILEMCRVAREVRIFPLLDIGGRRSAHLEPILSGLQEAGYGATCVPVAYEFQRGAKAFLCVNP